MTEFTRQSAMLSSLEGDAPYTINGIAIGEDDVTRGSSGIEKKWPADELKKAAASLSGRPLVVDHNNKVDGVVGKVTKADYKEGVGVIYEAQLYDEEVAGQISNELLEVSIRGYHIDVDEMDESEEGAKIVEGIKFDNLSIVPVGAAPSNTLQMGEAANLSEAQLEEYVGELEEDEEPEEEPEDSDDSDEDSEIEPSSFVQWGDKKGVVLEIEDGEAEVDVYTQVDDGWASSGETETVSTSELSSWGVDEEDITSMPDSDKGDSSDDEDSGTSDDEDDEESKEDDDPEEKDIEELFVQWDDGRGRVVEENEGLYTVELFEKADDGVWEPTGDTVDVETESVSEWSVTAESEEAASNEELSVDGISTGDAVKWSSNDGGDREPSGERYGVVVDELQDSDEGSVLVAVYQATSDYDGWENRDEQEKMKADNLTKVGSDGKGSLPAVSKVVEENTEGVEKELFRREKTDEDPHRYPEGDDEEENAENEDGESDRPSIPVITGDDLSASKTGDSEQLNIINMTLDDKIENLDNPVALEASELEELRQKADEVEELKEEQKTVSEMSESIAELRERQEILDEVDRTLVEELRDSDNAIVVESARFDELESEAETVKTLYAERVSEEMAAFDADELKEKYTLDELREKYEAVGGDIEEELTPDPKSTDPSDDEVEEAQEGTQTEEAEEISAKQEELRGKLFGGN